MATSMSSAFTAPERRKRVITYGKASRLAPIPPPAASSDAPSPERPRKQAAATNGSSSGSGPGLKAIGARNTSRAATSSADIFDVPSEDEFVTYAARPTKKLVTKRRVPEETRGTQNTDGEVLDTVRQSDKAAQSMRKPAPAKPAAPVARKTQKLVKPTQPSTAPTVPPEIAAARPTRRGKTPQPTTEEKASNVDKSNARPQIVTEKTSASTDVPAVPAAKIKKSVQSNPKISVKSVIAKAPAKPVKSTDVFDVPSSSDEAHMPTPKPFRRAPVVPRKENARVKPTQDRPRANTTESEDSETLKKRKRRGSASPAVAPKPVGENKQDDSLPQRSRKYPKNMDNISPGHNQPEAPTAPINTHAQLPAVNKPKRTRLRTVPLLTQPPIAKGQSSPATLHSMLPGSHTSRPSPIAEALSMPVPDDETMYEIPESLTTPGRRPPKPLSGSVTPRQKALFGSLLGTSSPSTTPMPSMSKLQLSDRKPASLLGALSRSKSDLTYSTEARKARLITSLKPAVSSSDDEASGSESDTGSEEDLEERTPRAEIAAKTTGNASKSHQDTTIGSDDMDVDNEVGGDSQMSQATSGFGIRSKLTYAKSRSYLQEANPEDALLMSMDLDEPVGFGSQTKDSQTEDEEEASQVRPNHELKRTGHNTRFQWDNQMLIDDITAKSGNSIRRSAMLDLCTKMLDDTFVHDLLDSSLADQYFANVESNGEVIFDFAVAVATIFMLRHKPSFTTLDQIRHSHLLSSLAKLLVNDNDIVKIAKNRKTNLSKMAKEAVEDFRTTVENASIWSPTTPEKISPQLVALKALELLVIGLRNTGNAEAIIGQETVETLVEIAASASEGCQTEAASTEAKVVLSTVFSILEAVSLAKQKPVSWSARTLQRLAASMSVCFLIGDTLTITLAVKLCMNLSNNKPKACQQFSGPDFVRSLVRSIISRTKLLRAGLEETQRAEALDTLILSLGAMINLTEHVDQARVNVDDGEQLIETLVKTFVDGSVRTAQAVSMEESQSSVAVGYLSVVLGNMCLNKSMKRKIRAHLPGGRLDALIDKIKEFVQVHEHVNRKSKQFEGEEGQETWQNYTARIMLVVEQLEATGM